jgi:hypothetical protein
MLGLWKLGSSAHSQIAFGISVDWVWRALYLTLSFDVEIFLTHTSEDVELFLQKRAADET